MIAESIQAAPEIETALASIAVVVGAVGAGLATYLAGTAARARRSWDLRFIEDLDEATETIEGGTLASEEALAALLEKLTGGESGRPELPPEERELAQRLGDRLDAIERRLPDADTVDKIASVNDAILATKIEALEKQVEELKGSSLSRWDVAVVVFAIVAAFGAITGLVTGLIKLLG